MIKLYFDSNIADWTYVIFKTDWNEKVKAKDLKGQKRDVIKNYVCLRYILDLDDEWELVFGTSYMMKKENIDDFKKIEDRDDEKIAFLEDFFNSLQKKAQVPQIKDLKCNELVKKIRKLGIDEKDAIHLAEATIGKSDYFITMDNDFINKKNKTKRNKLEDLAGLKIRTPYQFVEEIIGLKRLVTALHGSWVSEEKILNLMIEDIESNQSI